jgi:putative NIF3 family GTP cyclohydrolase 1 type 2
MSIQQAIDTLIADVPGAPFSETVDTIKIGDASRPLTSIAITFLANAAVIQKASQMGVELLITHEPTFYNHLDKVDWLSQQPTYLAKRKLLEDNKLVVWRFHDYLHSIQPDPTLVGLIREMGWDQYVVPDSPFVCHIPPISFADLQQLVKDKLGSKAPRVIGDPTLICKGVGLLPGFPPADFQIGVLGRPDVDVLIAGEIHEWETSEFTRDSNLLGYKKGLIVTGHAVSEEPGLRAIIPWIQERLPGIPVTYIPTTSAFN